MVIGPADFRVSCLTIRPESVRHGQSAAVTVMVTNSGEAGGTFEAMLLANGSPVETRTVTLAEGPSKASPVFTFTPTTPGLVELAVGRARGTVTVQPAQGLRGQRPRQLGDVKVLAPDNIPRSHPTLRTGLSPIQGAGFDHSRGTLWLAEATNPAISNTPNLYENTLFEFDLLGCDGSNPPILTRLIVPAPGDGFEIEEMDIDPADGTLFYLNSNGHVHHVDRAGREIHRFPTVLDHHPVSGAGGQFRMGRWGLAVVGDVLWVSNMEAIYQLEKTTGRPTGWFHLSGPLLRQHLVPRRLPHVPGEAKHPP